jgi:hypothetical protein
VEQEQGISTCQYVRRSENDGHPFSEIGSEIDFSVPPGNPKLWNLWKSRQCAVEHELCYGCFSPCQPAPALVACRESSAIALKFYERAFKTPDSKPEIYFNFEVDTLFLRSDVFNVAGDNTWDAKGSIHDFESDLADLVDPADLQKVQSLALVVDQSKFNYLARFEDWLADILRIFLGVKKLTLVMKYLDKTDGDHSSIFFADLIDLAGSWEKLKKYFSNPVGWDHPEEPWYLVEPFGYLSVKENWLAEHINNLFPNEGERPVIPLINYRVAFSIEFLAGIPPPDSEAFLDFMEYSSRAMHSAVAKPPNWFL